MERPAELNIEVTISQELRDLFAGRQLSHKGKHPVKSIGYVDTAAHEKPQLAQSICWPSIILRRDAARPLKFHGLPVLTFSDAVQLDDVTCHHSVSVYTSACKEMYLSLILHLPSESSARSLYRGFVLRPDTLQNKLADWHEELMNVAQTVTAFSPPDAKLQDIRAAFEKTTSHCFQFK